VRRAIRSRAALTALAAGAALFSLAAPAQAAAGKWRIDSLSNTTIAPGGTVHYLVQMTNVGNAPLDAGAQEVVLSGTLPKNVSFTGLTQVRSLIASWNCAGSAGSTVHCVDKTDVWLAEGIDDRTIQVDAVAGAGLPPGKTVTASWQVSGGGAGAGSASTVDPSVVSATPAPFGVEAFDGQFASDATGTAEERAGAHPFDQSTSVDFNTADNSLPLKGTFWPVEPIKDVRVDLPPGFVGNPGVTDTCTPTQLVGISPIQSQPLCPATSQVGTVEVRFNGGPSFPGAYPQTPLYSLTPPTDAPARFGFNITGSVVTFAAVLRSDGSYAISADSVNIPQALPVAGTTVRLWGVPADPVHDRERACPEELSPAFGGPFCEEPGAPLIPFLRNPTSCTAPPASPVSDGLLTSVAIDSWVHPGAWNADAAPDLGDPAWKTASFVSHQPPGYPYSPKDTTTPWGARYLPGECAAEPFAPSFAAKPTTNAADSPSGLEVDLSMPQQGLEEPGAISESDLRAARVVLPAGMSVNPSAAGGRGACSPAQIGLQSAVGQTPVRFDAGAPQCPDNSKLGTLELQSPLLAERDDTGAVIRGPGGVPVLSTLKGSVYLAAQGENPFGSLLAMYLVVEDERLGTDIKLAGQIVPNPTTGQIETVFDENPQLPFSHLHLDLFGGQRAALRTPPSCGTYTSTATLTPWSGNAAVSASSSFPITQGCGGGFNPQLQAGTKNPLAAQTSPFSLRLTREDGEGELGALSLTLPPGLSGYLKGIPYCPDSTLAAVSGELGAGKGQEASPSCPAASQLGTVTVGAGAGTNPFYTSAGRAYLAGPYKGAPLSLAVVAPAVAGPFDLGSVVVRNALQVDPSTAQITAVSDPLPSILHGIPLDLRDVRVDLNRDHFTLNPTSCEPMQIASTITSTQGATASPSQHFQVGNCDQLAFKPKLALRLKGGTKRSKFPSLRATLKMPAANSANIARAAVTLPPGLQIENAHIQEPCTRVQFNANACPPKSILGSARAFSPLLDSPLEGPVYFRSNGGEHLLPDIVADLRGQIHVVLVGHIDSVENKHSGVVRIRNTFETVPDAPVSKFTLSLFGGKKGYLTNNRNLCNSANRALVKFDGQNGKIADSTPAIKTDCGGGKGKHKRRR
jgi:uncharacterized repeat protein (TIGR01451 family)